MVRMLKKARKRALFSMAIRTLTLEKVQELCVQRDKLEDEVEELNKATPESLWLRELDGFLARLDAQALQEAKDEEYELNNMAGDAARIFRQVGKNQRKNRKKPAANVTEQMEVEADTSISTATETVKVAEAPKLPRKRALKKPAAKTSVESDKEEDEELLELKDRLQKYNLNSSPSDQSAMDTETVVGQRKEPGRSASQKPQPVYTEISDDDEYAEQLNAVPEEELSLMPKKSSAA